MAYSLWPARALRSVVGLLAFGLWLLLLMQEIADQVRNDTFG